MLLHTFTATYQVSVLLRLSALWNYHTDLFSSTLSQMFLLFRIRISSLHSQTRIRIDTSRRQSYISNIRKYSGMISFVLLPTSYRATLIVWNSITTDSNNTIRSCVYFKLMWSLLLFLSFYLLMLWIINILSVRQRKLLLQ